MEENFLIEFTYNEIKNIVTNYYKDHPYYVNQPEFNLEDYNDIEIRRAL